MSAAGTTSAEPERGQSATSGSRIRRTTVTAAPLSIDRLYELVAGPEVGGVALFVGVVRNRDVGNAVVSLDYTQHPQAEAVLLACAERVAEQYDVLTVAVEHRVGHLVVGDLAVVVAVGAEHRGAALAACTQLIDDLKASVPIWKEQHFVGGDTEWVGLP